MSSLCPKPGRRTVPLPPGRHHVLYRSARLRKPYTAGPYPIQLSPFNPEKRYHLSDGRPKSTLSCMPSVRPSPQYAGNPKPNTRNQNFIPRRPQYPGLSPSLPSSECQPYWLVPSKPPIAPRLPLSHLLPAPFYRAPRPLTNAVASSVAMVAVLIPSAP